MKTTNYKIAALISAGAMLAYATVMPISVTAAVSSDALHLFRALTVSGEMTKADDYNNDGKVNASDASTILAYYAYISTSKSISP